MAEPIRVGILNDMSAGPPAPDRTEHWLRLATDELIRNGRIDRPVEFVNAWGLGFPSGTAAAVEHAYEKLAAEDAILIVGLAIGDNALLATPLTDKYRIPTIHWAGAERARGEYMFQLQVGSHEDESVILARYLASQNVKRLGVVHDRSPIGRRHLQFLQAEAEAADLRIAFTTSVSPLAESATAEVDDLIGSGADTILYMGLGVSAPAVARALTARRWDGRRVMNASGLRGYDPKFAEIVDGWVYLDMCSDDNTTFAALRQRMNLPRADFGVAVGHDFGRLVAEGLARAPERTREGVKEGLEQVKWLPAAEGYEGTTLGFGKYDRGALHGRYLVLRQWQGGKTVQLKD